MNTKANDLSQALELAGLEIDDLEISHFLDDEFAQQSDTVSKVMAASCTTCECCCSCLLLKAPEISLPATPFQREIERLEASFTEEQIKFIKSTDPKVRDPQRYAEAEWPRLLGEVALAMAHGIDPASEKAGALARRWSELLNLFTGGREDIKQTLTDMHKAAPQQNLAGSLGTSPSFEMIEYISKAAEHSRDKK